MILLISSFGVIDLVIREAMTKEWPDTNIFLWTVGSVANAIAVIPNGITALLGDGFCTFFIRHRPIFSNGLKSLFRNSPDCHFLCNWVVYNFILAGWTFAKALRSFYACVLVNKKLCSKLFSSLESSTFQWKFQT